jgi:hypothetical protein
MKWFMKCHHCYVSSNLAPDQLTHHHQVMGIW